MSKKQKKKLSFNIFPDWSYVQEQKDLDRRSAEGWHLVKPGQYFHKYEQDTAKRYRYQMDYQSIEPEMGRYEEIYNEQGWEYLECAGGWHYFRKLYDPMLPEDAYEIFTDEESIAALRKRWAKSSVISLIFSLLAFIIEGALFFWFPMWRTLIPLIFFGIATLYCIYSIRMIRHPEKQKGPRVAFFVAVFYALALTVGVFGYVGIQIAHIYVDIGHAHFDTYSPIPAGIENAVELDTFDIYLSDNYFMDFLIIADAPLCFSILIEQGEIVYTVTDSNYHSPKQTVRLKKGSYTAYLSDFAGGKASVYYKFE